MKYSIEPWLFEKVPDVCFGILIGENMSNSVTSEEDDQIVRRAETKLRGVLASMDPKEEPYIAKYRSALQNVGINPNKYTNSVEAMCKRVVKGSSLPAINSLVDRCNAISLEEIISLGGHDLKEIHEDLCVRRSKKGDSYLPFGATVCEELDDGEVIFTSGAIVQTRQWLWRQSEIGKMTLDTKDVFFQLVGFDGEHLKRLESAMDSLATLITNKFNGTVRKYIVNKDRQGIEF
jgi:DNA/RNA-binding domain of Phe-tRNA-synthetase-like protein